MSKLNIKGFCRAGVLCLSALLLGCVAAETKSVSSSTDALSSAKLELTKNPEFSTKDKSTKTIDTPWGPREIYDPTQNEEFTELFSKYRNNDYVPNESVKFRHQYTQNFQRRVMLDYARNGCVSVKDALCTKHSTKFFAKNCDVQHNFGKLSLSECEKANYRLILPPAQVLIHNCEFNGKQHQSNSYSKATNLIEAVDMFNETECLAWNRDFLKEK